MEKMATWFLCSQYYLGYFKCILQDYSKTYYNISFPYINRWTILPSSRNSAALPASLAIFRTELFSHTCSICCCSSVIGKVSFLYRHAGVTQVLVTFSILEIHRSVITPSTDLHAFATDCALRRTHPSLHIHVSSQYPS